MGFWPTRNRYNAATKRRISNIFPYFKRSSIDIIHSIEKEVTTSENSNYKSYHVASNLNGNLHDNVDWKGFYGIVYGR